MNNTRPIHRRVVRLNCIIFAKLSEILQCEMVHKCSNSFVSVKSCVSLGDGCWLNKTLILCCVAAERSRTGLSRQHGSVQLLFEDLLRWACV